VLLAINVPVKQHTDRNEFINRIARFRFINRR